MVFFQWTFWRTAVPWKLCSILQTLSEILGLEYHYIDFITIVKYQKKKKKNIQRKVVHKILTDLDFFFSVLSQHSQDVFATWVSEFLSYLKESPQWHRKAMAIV